MTRDWRWKCENGKRMRINGGIRVTREKGVGVFFCVCVCANVCVYMCACVCIY